MNFKHPTLTQLILIALVFTQVPTFWEKVTIVIITPVQLVLFGKDRGKIETAMANSTDLIKL